MHKIYLDWKVGWCREIDQPVVDLMEAVVPGAVQLDYQKAKKLQDYKYANNYLRYEWMEDVYWKYCAVLDFTLKKIMNAFFSFRKV